MSLTDSEVKNLQAGQTLVAKAASKRQGFRLWTTGRNVREALRWPTFLPEEPLYSGVRVAEMSRWYASEGESFEEGRVELDVAR
jgi:hypothetical protein